MIPSKKRKNDDGQDLFDDIRTRQILSLEELKENNNQGRDVPPENPRDKPLEVKRVECVKLTSFRERRAPPNIFRNKQQQVTALKTPDLTSLRDDPEYLTYPKGIFAKGNEGALLAYFVKISNSKCDAKCHRAMPCQIIEAIYTATLRLQTDIILLETVPQLHKTLGIAMSQLVGSEVKSQTEFQSSDLSISLVRQQVGILIPPR